MSWVAMLRSVLGMLGVLGMLLAGCGSPSEQLEPMVAEPAPAPAPAPVSAQDASPPPAVVAAPADPVDASRAQAPAAEPGADGKSFTVVARLADAGRPTPHCGRIHAVAVMKLEVIRVEDGRFTGDTLYIYVSCPELLLSKTVGRLEVGASYRMVLDTRIHLRTDGAKFDAFDAVEQPRYRLIRVLERVEP
jgi:hypothetical protein